ncbi:Uncharacterised protein [Candidatus Bartonella washoeensis]|nr:Uncharacterised protein [Bartonella washoeensis]
MIAIPSDIKAEPTAVIAGITEAIRTTPTAAKDAATQPLSLSQYL